MNAEKIQLHLILIGQSGRSITETEKPLLGKKALPYQQDPDMTRELIDILESLKLETERPKEARTTLMVTGTKEQFEKIFSAHLVQKETSKQGIEWEWGGTVTIPGELRRYASGVALPTRPDFPPSP